MFAPRIAKQQTKASVSPTSSAAGRSSMLPGQRTSNVTWRDHEREAGPENSTAREALRSRSWNFSKISVFSPDSPNRTRPSGPLAPTPLPGAIQAKLVVGSVADPLEHEADRVADQVMRMADPDLSRRPSALQISRKCDACEEEQRRQVHTRPAEAPAAARDEVPSIVHEVLRSPGQPLDAPTLAFFEPRFQQDLRHVRVHIDSLAAESARSVSALAYTAGRDVVFGFSGTIDRKRLLAHELVHVQQQTNAPTRANLLQRQDTGGPIRGEEGESLPGGPGMERTVPRGTKEPAPALPGSPEAVRDEAEQIGEQWGKALADKDLALGTLQNKIGGLASVWDRMKPEERKAQVQRIEDDFALLPVLPQHDEPDLASAQEDGFAAGVQSGYSLEKIKAFLVKLGGDIAIIIFSGLVARGVRLPRFIRDLIQRSVPQLVAPGTGVAFGETMAEEMLKSGFKGNPFREFLVRLNAAPVRLPPKEAAEAIRVATNKISGGTMGTMPPIQQGDILVVPSRAPIPNAPVMGIRGDGTVIIGRARLNWKLVDNSASRAGRRSFPPGSPASPARSSGNDDAVKEI